LDALAANDDPVRRTEIAEHFALASSDEERIEALTALMRADADDRLAELRSMLIRRWAAQDPPAAAAWLAQWPDHAATRELHSQVAIAWADTDLPRALEWVQSLPAGETKTAA